MCILTRFDLCVYVCVLKCSVYCICVNTVKVIIIPNHYFSEEGTVTAASPDTTLQLSFGDQSKEVSLLSPLEL